MGKLEKILWQVLKVGSDQNIAFDDLVFLLEGMGFEKRIKGSHHLFSKEGVEEIINIQPAGNKAKLYQVRQVRHIIVKYQLIGE
ncbi:type II toxin-antitoxin system HicA family toxin [Candidatus Ferrigenium straubiae]|jgi:predicted RNA binding protein YcfA (HicA-like mRNA interferase family)|uniref:type II toxin-antitoxin system HicA family toxin n=1 Tax=Candidatus Ferrigenium straubiae TaxID=2919506 RepID=UPI003F4AA8F5